MADNPFAEELKRRKNPFQVQLAGIPVPSPQEMQNLNESDFAATGRGVVNRLADAVLNIPEAIHDFSPMNVATLPQNVRAQRNIPLPTGREAVAGIETVLETPRALMADGAAPPFADRFQQNLGHAEQLAEANPIATGVGHALGDAATIATGRVPLARTKALQFLREGTQSPIFFGKAASQVKPTNLRLLNQFVQSPTVTKIARGAGRTLEAGFEGAALAALHDGDPLQTAAYTAGGQALGSLAISGTSTKGGIKPLTVRAATLAFTIQLTKSFLPGGKDRSLESIEESVDSIKLALILGAAGRVAGAGRFSEDILNKTMPRIAETVNSMHRGAIMSVVEQATNDRTGAIEAVLQKLATNPNAFNANQRARLERALNNGKLDSEIDKLMQVQSFREAME